MERNRRSELPHPCGSDGRTGRRRPRTLPAAAPAVALALWLGWVHPGPGPSLAGVAPQGESNPEPAADTPPEEAGPVFGVLRRPVELSLDVGPTPLSRPIPVEPLSDPETLSTPFVAPAGSLVYLRRSPRYRNMALADGRNLAQGRKFSPEDYEEIGIEEARERFAAGLEGLSFLALVEPDLESTYVATVLPGDRLLNYSANSVYNYFGPLLFPPGLELHLYQDGRRVGATTVARLHRADAMGQPGFDIAAIDAAEPYDESRPLIASPRPLPADGTARTPEWGELRERPKRLDSFEQYYNYEAIGPLDLDGDGVNEILFREYGLESVFFTIFKHLGGEWRLVYRGGGMCS